MPAEYVNGNVRAACPSCGGAVTTYEQGTGGSNWGQIGLAGLIHYQDKTYGVTTYRLLRCAGCGRGGLAVFYEASGVVPALIDFYPFSRETAPLPPATPPGVVAEYREAELCAAVRAWRAASALLRSVLEKTLTVNGYANGSLQARIDAAAGDGVLTAARQRRAHEDVRVLGNDVLHDEWREVSAEEYGSAHRYVQRILEDFYDLRAEVEATLIKAKRLPNPKP
jgi:hypothetical protein